MDSRITAYIIRRIADRVEKLADALEYELKEAFRSVDTEVVEGSLPDLEETVTDARQLALDLYAEANEIEGRE